MVYSFYLKNIMFLDNKIFLINTLVTDFVENFKHIYLSYYILMLRIEY